MRASDLDPDYNPDDDPDYDPNDDPERIPFSSKCLSVAPLDVFVLGRIAGQEPDLFFMEYPKNDDVESYTWLSQKTISDAKLYQNPKLYVTELVPIAPDVDDFEKVKLWHFQIEAWPVDDQMIAADN